MSARPLTVREVSERLGVSKSLIYEWIQGGVLECLRFGREGKRGTIRITEEALAEFVQACKQG